MTLTTLLNFQFQPAQNPTNSDPKAILFIHGLFGDLNNLGVIARAFADEYHILRVDLRNHGASFHSDKMNLTLMAEDISAVIRHLNLKKVILVGHSLGGKTAMTFAHHYPDQVEKLIVIDIAPVAYREHRHTAVFEGLFAVKQARPANRQQAKAIISGYIDDESIQQFMLKSFDPEHLECFKFNVSALAENYLALMDWEKVSVLQPTLFIKGANSDYMLKEYTADAVAQFPHSKLYIISNAGHWVHAEKPANVIQAISDFLRPADKTINSRCSSPHL